jgi:hypothetical protein
MTGLVLLALLIPAPVHDCVTKSTALTTLVVQAVDELWLPIPGAVVLARGQGKVRDAFRVTADADGFARFSISTQGAYEVEVSAVGFKTRRVKSVSVEGDPAKSVPNVQVMLKVAGPMEIIE